MRNERGNGDIGWADMIGVETSDPRDRWDDPSWLETFGKAGFNTAVLVVGGIGIAIGSTIRAAIAMRKAAGRAREGVHAKGQEIAYRTERVPLTTTRPLMSNLRYRARSLANKYIRDL